MASRADCPNCGNELWFAHDETGGVVVARLNCSELRPAHLDGILHEFVAEGRLVHLVLDFEDVRHLYSADLAKMIILKKEIGAGGGSLKVRHLHSDLREVFRITRLDEVFKVDH